MDPYSIDDFGKYVYDLSSAEWDVFFERLHGDDVEAFLEASKREGMFGVKVDFRALGKGPLARRFRGYLMNELEA